MKHIIGTLLIALATLAFVSCSSSDNSSPEENYVYQFSTEKTIDNIPNVQDQWTYISLEQGRVVGSCPLSDADAQTDWGKRTDWDIAICNGLIRTNSGSSGIGEGGITVMPAGYDETTNTPVPAFRTDSELK